MHTQGGIGGAFGTEGAGKQSFVCVEHMYLCVAKIESWGLVLLGSDAHFEEDFALEGSSE